MRPVSAARLAVRRRFLRRVDARLAAWLAVEAEFTLPPETGSASRMSDADTNPTETETPEPDQAPDGGAEQDAETNQA